MNIWDPIIDNTKGILFFQNKINNQIQFDYPKQYNNISGEYEDIFFENWIKEEIVENDSFDEKSYVWKNINNGLTQNINPNSTTFILEAALNDNFAFFELFIEYGGDINYEDKLKRNCLHYIAINDNYKLANLLIKLGCNINKRDIYGITPFLYCIKNFSFKTMKLLVENNCNINARDNKGNTALHYSVINQNTKLIIYLLKHGAKLEIKNNKGKYPIDLAIDKNYVKISKILAKYSYLIDDENHYKLKEIVNSEKYDDLIKKKYKLLEEEEEEKQNNKNKKENKLKNNSKSKNKIIKNDNRKYNSNNKNISNIISPILPSKNNKKRIIITKEDINLNLSPIKNNKKALVQNKNINKNNKYLNNPHFTGEIINNSDINNINDTNYNDSSYNFKTFGKKKNKNYNKNEKYNKDNKIQIKTSNISNQDNTYLDNIKYYLNIFFLFLLNTVFPYIKNNSMKFYNYSIKKGKKLYKYLKIYFQNTYVYYNNTPDIENQIEYLNYSSISSSRDEIQSNFLLSNNNDDNSKISHKFKIKYSINENNKKINNIFKKRKLNYFDKRYIYKIAYKFIYNLNDDILKINEKKIIQIIKKFHKDKKFIKSLKSHFNLNLKKIFLKYLKTRKYIYENNNISNKEQLFNRKDFIYKNIEYKNDLEELNFFNIKLNSNKNYNYQRYDDEKEEDIFKLKDINNIENKEINDLFNNNNINSNYEESIYSKKINKTLDNINSMLDEINEINNNQLFDNNNEDFKIKKGIKLNRRKNIIGNINVENNINNKNYLDKNKILIINENKNLSIGKEELLEKILLDYNSQLKEIKN